MIDISMTATLRPEIHEKVIESLDKHLKTQHDIRLVINIDKKGRSDVTQQNVLDRFKKVKWISEIKSNLPKNPKFFNALTWVWENSVTNYVLQWEDDWVLHKDLYLDDFLYIMKKRNTDIFGFFCKPKINAGLKLQSEIVNDRKYSFVKLNSPLPSFTPSILTQNYLEPMVYLMKSTNTDWQRPIQFVKNTPDVRKLLQKMNHMKYISEDYKKTRNRNLLTDIGQRWKKDNNISIK